MSEENVEIVRRVWDVWERGPDQGNPRGLWMHGLLAPDFVLKPPPEIPDMLPSYVGEDGFLEFLDLWTENFEEWAVRAERIIDAGGSRVVSIAHQSGIGKESGALVELHFGMVSMVEGGRITEAALYVTPKEALEAAGLRE